MYLWVKAFHIIFFTAWFAGLFYLPRIYVNLAMVEDKKTYNHLLLMASKLLRFISPFMIITIFLGLWLLYLNPGTLKYAWMHLKLTLVALLIIYHLICVYYLKQFTEKKSSKSHIYYRWFNELPVLILFAVVILAVLKPF